MARPRIHQRLNICRPGRALAPSEQTAGGMQLSDMRRGGNLRVAPTGPAAEAAA